MILFVLLNLLIQRVPGAAIVGFYSGGGQRSLGLRTAGAAAATGDHRLVFLADISDVLFQQVDWNIDCALDMAAGEFLRGMDVDDKGAPGIDGFQIFGPAEELAEEC